MNQTTIENPELAFIFDDDSYNGRRGKRSFPEGKEKEELLKLYQLDDIKFPEQGHVVSAKYQGKTKDQFLFRVRGYKDDIRIDDKLSESKYLKNSSIGDVIDVLIIEVDHDDFAIKGSISSLYESRAHQNLKSLEEGQSVTAYIRSLNPAGYDVELSHGGVTLPGFMPNTLAGINKLHDPNLIIGQTFEVMIESYSEQEGTYIVSRRKYLQSLIPAAVKQLKYGEVYTGHVTGTTPFGIFVEFSFDKDEPCCLTGMIHKANVDPEWAENLTSIKPGFQIEFYVKEVI